MNLNELFILGVSLTVTISGYYLNFSKKASQTELLREVEDNSLFAFRMAIPMALVISLMLFFLKVGTMDLPNILYQSGYFITVIGLLIRFYAVHKLGKSFRVKVSLVKDQKLQTNGIYRWMRHPSYTGLLIYYFGLGIVMQNYYCLGLLIVIPIFIVLYRIKFEEKFLIDVFGKQYIKYKENSYKLFPFVY